MMNDNYNMGISKVDSIKPQTPQSKESEMSISPILLKN